MNWIPPVLQPFDTVMAVLLLTWFFACSLQLHRASRYYLQWKALQGLPAAIEQQRWALTQGRDCQVADPLLLQLCELVRHDQRAEALEEFHSTHVVPQREPDQTNDRGLQGLSQIAPLFGLLGTVLGLLTAFVSVGSGGDTITLADLGVPVSSALMTTAHGALCAGLCIATRTVLATRTLHEQQDRLLVSAWKQFVAALPPPPPPALPAETIVATDY